MAQKILIDTSVIIEGGEDIVSKLDKVAPVFVSDIVLQELDGHKINANQSVAYRARNFFKALGNSNGVALDTLPPDGMRLEKTDTLRRMALGATPLYVIVREQYKSRDINDSKIIEIAKDYNMTLVTLDTAQRVRAMSKGVDAVTVEAVLPIENFKEEVKAMSEVENEVVDEKKEVNFSLTWLLVAIALIIASLIFSSSIWSYIFFFVGLGIITSMTNKKLNKVKMTSSSTNRIKKTDIKYISNDSAISQLQSRIEMENKEKERTQKPWISFGRDDDYSKNNFKKLTDPRYSSMPGNVWNSSKD